MNCGDRELTKHIRPKTSRSRQLQLQPHHSLEQSDELPPAAVPINEASSPPPLPLSKPAAVAATSILRRSKYSTPTSATSFSAASVTPENASAAGDESATETEMVKTSADDDTEPIVVQDFVVEKRRRKKETNNSVTQQPANSTSGKTTAGLADPLSTTGDVEGYVPRTTGIYSMNVSTSSSAAPDLAETKAVKGGMERPATSDIIISADDDDDKPKKSGDDDDNDDDPLVFNSLADLMAMAGTLPNQDDDKSNSPVMIEAELQFSCMDQDEFQQEQQQVFYGKQNIFDNDNTDESTSPRSDDDDGNDDDDEDDLWDVLGLGGSMDGEDEEPASPPRAFLQLWTALSQWVTPEAAEFVAAIQAFEKVQFGDNESSTTAGTTTIPTKAFVAPKTSIQNREPPSDVALSRCAGLMAALRLHTARCWHLLNSGRSNELRTVEMTLADLLRCFDYSRPMPPSLDLALTRALACVLLHTVAPVVGASSLLVGEKGTTTTDVLVPKPCAVLGMTADEYTYLVRSAIVAFGKTSIEDDSQQ